MKFEQVYTPEQEQFRQEVRTWLEENVPADMAAPVDMENLTDELYTFARQLHVKLVEKGWLFPTMPKEYGGGGLTGEHETILEEEFNHKGVIRALTNGLVFPTLLVWGTEEQKRKFLVPLLKTEKVAFQGFTEPKGGADLAGLESRAVRDGDDWLITGTKCFVSGQGVPDYIFGPMVTDPEAPRHRNLGFFLIPNPSPGLTIQKMNLVNGHSQHFIFMDDVRVAGDHLIGGDHQGWQVAGTTLEQEHGGRGQAFPRDRLVENMVSYVQETKRGEEGLGKDPLMQQVVLDGYLEAHIYNLLAQRDFWMYQNRMEMSYHGPESNVHSRVYSLRNGRRVREVMGLYAQLDGKDPRAPFEGQPNVYQRSVFARDHGAGSLNIAKVIVARRIGISRTQERAAPTPATATSYSS